MKFQSQYEIDFARIKEKNIVREKNIDIWHTIKETIPVSYFKKQGYLQGSLDKDILLIFDIFNVTNIEGLLDGYANSKSAFFRKSEKLQIDQKNMYAWSSLAQYEAKRLKIEGFSFEQIDRLCEDLNQIFCENKNTTEKATKKLHQFGIKFIQLSKMEKTPVDGFSFWSGQNPSIAITLRHHRIDNFAFTIMHEIGHIALHLRKNKETQFLDFTKTGTKNSFELEADAFAQQKLISKIHWDEVVENQHHLSDDKIISLANKPCYFVRSSEF